MMKLSARSVLVPVLVFALQLNCYGILPPLKERLPNYDKRTPGAQVSAEQQAALNTLQSRLPRAHVDFNEITSAPKMVLARDGFLSGPGGQGGAVSAAALSGLAQDDPYRSTKAFLQEYRSLFGHGPEALARARIRREFVTAHNSLKTTVWQQEANGIPVFDCVLVSHTLKDGELVSLSSEFVRNEPVEMLAAQGAAAQTPVIPAAAAVRAAALDVGQALSESDIILLSPSPAQDSEQRQVFEAPGLSGETTAALVWLPVTGQELRLCWDILLASGASGEMFRIVVDAQTGEPVLRRSLTEYLTDASYRVYVSDSPSPFSPGHSTPQTTQPPQVSRVLVTWPALSTNASPAGWITDGGNETLGNNVDAHTDRNYDNMPDLPRPQGSPFRVFDCAMDLALAPATYTNASVVQLFYWNNWMHDRLYDLGFTEAAGNFQTANFGRGGLGNDAVQADAQDGSGTDNANFSTPPDGSPGRMQMFLFTGPTPDRDGDFDAEIVLHEYAHGLSNRRVGGGVGISALQSRGLGEGWSDFYPLSLLSEAGDAVHGVYAAGGYATYLLSGLTQNYYFGIRRYPYCTDMTKNPLTFRDIDPAQASAHTGVPRNPIIGTTANEVHNMGEVWCVTLWDARANLIAKHGWAIGNEMMLQLVTDAMNLSPANPNFVQARDAILLADHVNNGGANRAELWAAFAKRGLGFHATSPSSSTTVGLVESFDPPDDLAVTPATGLIAIGPVGGPFTPNSVSYVLTNGGSNTITWRAAKSSQWFDLSLAGGTLSPGGPSATCAVALNSLANSQPIGVYHGAVWFTNVTSGVIQSRAISLRAGQLDYFTELFDTANDLDYQSFTFTPNGSPHFYSACREVVTNFPTDPAGGITVSLGDDNYARVTLSGTNQVSVYNTRSNAFFIGSNGYITFMSGDSSTTESLANHFSQPRVSALYDDLYPSANVSWKQLTNRVAVTFLNVRQYGYSDTNSFQIELFYNGTIRLTYLRLDATDGLAGLSQGLGTPENFLESDFTAYGPCNLPLHLDALSGATEGSIITNGGVLSLPLTLSSNLTVTLASSDTTEVTVPAGVTIPAGQTNAMFPVTLVDDGVLDGTQLAIITASAAPAFAAATASVRVYDSQTATLQVILPATVTEGQGTVPGSVRVNAAPAANVLVELASGDAAEVQLPDSVLIAAGQTNASFNATVLDDGRIDGPQTVDVTATVENWGTGTAHVTVLDNETTNLTVSLPASARENAGALPNAGTVSLSGTLQSNLVVMLASSDLTELAVPATVTVPAGAAFATFHLNVMNDPAVDGAQFPQVTATASGFASGSASMTIYDDESPPAPSSPSPAHLATNVNQTVNLSWQSGAQAGETITNDVYIGTDPVPGAEQFVGSTTNTSWTLPLLAPLTTYYWQIVARKAGSTPGPVWRFTTRGVDHFDLGSIASPQLVGTPFPVTITSRDMFGQVVSNFTGSVSLSGMGGTAQVTNRMLDAVTHSSSGSGTYTWGYSFRPTNDLVVTHFRHYFGTNVTLWSATGTMLARKGGVTPYGVWKELALDQPVALSAGSNYLVTAYVPGTVYYWITNTTIAFPHGPILQSLYCGSNGFPTLLTSAAWPMVGLRYTAGTGVSLPVAPTNSGAFTNGSWTGQVAVLEPATNVALIAADDAGHSVMSSRFDVLLTNDLSVLMTGQPDPVAVSAYLTNRITVLNSGPDTSTGVEAIHYLPPSAAFVSASLSQGTYVVESNRVAFALGTLPGGASATITLVTRPMAGGAITNIVVVGRNEAEPYFDNNTAMTVTDVEVPSLRIADVNVPEGNSGYSAAVFQVTLFPPFPANVRVRYATADGSAQAGSDYLSTPGLLVFAPGQTNATVSVPIIGDTTGEPNETFSVVLSNAVQAVIVQSTAVGTILNDDLPPYVYLRSAVGAPWGSTANETAMNRAFGISNWQDLRYETVVAAHVFSPVNRFVYMEGSDYNALELQAFLATNLTVIQDWVAAGGCLFVNAAPNEGSGMYLGFGVSLTRVLFGSGMAVSPAHLIFQGPFSPVGESWTGNSFAHANVSGTNLVPLIVSAANGPVLLGEMYYGRGIVRFGGMTTDNYHSPQPQASNLRANILACTAWHSSDTNSPPVIRVQPASQTAAVGGNAVLYTFCSGSAPLSYQWRKNGINIGGATQSSLAFNNVTTNDAGLYSVVVSNAFGTATSSNAVLTVMYSTTLDAFNPIAGATVFCTAVQPDGRILVGGSFSQMGGQSRQYLARLNADGTLDRSFNPVLNGTVYCLAIQPDGKIVVGGGFNVLAGQPRSYIGRLNPDGSLDASFAPVANSTVYSLVIQPDGKLVVGGAFTTLSGQTRNYIGRLNAAGALDSSFNPGANSTVYALALETNGNIVVGGSFTTLAGQSRSCIGRLQPDGTLDTSFNSSANSSVWTLAIQSDGKIVAGGGFTTLGGSSRSYLGRLLPSGGLDTTFNPVPNSSVYSIVLQADGKILAGGSFTTLAGQSRVNLGRLNPDGTVDAGFRCDANSTVYSLGVQEDGKVLVGGAFGMLAGQARACLARLTASGPVEESLLFDGASIDWLRGGTAPEIGWTAFSALISSNETTLGNGTRISGGWRLAGLALPTNTTIRARGYAAGGRYAGSGWIVETYGGLPVILTQPTNASARPGATITLFIRAEGSPTLEYQWMRDGTNLVNDGRIAGTASPQLTISGVLESDSGAYAVRVTNALGSATSSNALVLISPLDHFGWSAIASPQYLNEPFDVTITALDMFNQPVTNYTGPVALGAETYAPEEILSATNPSSTGPYPMYSASLPVLPTVSGLFTNGTWTGAVTVQQPATNAVLTARTPQGHAGSSDPFEVAVQNDLAIRMAATPNPVSAGSNLLYVLTIANSGPTDATAVRVTDTLPATVAFVSAVPSQGTCAYTNGVLVADLGTLTGPAQATVSIAVRPLVASVITNVATVSRGEADPYPDNNSAAACTVVSPPGISVADTSAPEGNIGTSGLVFNLSLTAPSVLPISIAYSTSGGTATPGTDYIATNGVLVFPPGTTNGTITVTIIGDLAIESSEYVYLYLNNPTNCTLGSGSRGTGMILNDDGLDGDVYTLQWGSVGSLHYVSRPFLVSLTARDAANRIATNFNGTVALSACSGWGTNVLGTETATVGFPMYVGYHDERTQVIYPAAEVGPAGRLTALALDVSTVPGRVLQNWTVRLKHSPLSAYSNAFWEGAGWTVVYQTNLSVTSTGWVTFPFTTPFDFDGSNSLMVDFSFNNTGYSSGGYCRGTYRSSLRTVYYRTDSQYGDPLTWNGSSPTPYTTTYTPNLRLICGGGPTEVSASPASIGPFQNGLWTGRISVNELATNIVLVADDRNGHSAVSTAFATVLGDDLSVDITDAPDPVSAGSNLVYTITVANSGPSSATGVLLTNLLPATADFLSATSSQGHILNTPLPRSARTIVCNLGTIYPQATATVTITAVPTVAGLSLSNVVSVTRAESDPAPSNNTAFALTTVHPPVLTVDDASVLEGDAGIASLVFGFHLNAPCSQPVTMQYATADESAAADADYLGTAGALTIPPGQTNLDLAVVVLGDRAVEPHETFWLNLTAPVNATLNRVQATGTIVNDDGLHGQVDHFALGAVPSPQYTDMPFDLTITAVDSYGEPATNFNGTAGLSAVTGESALILLADFETGLQEFTIDNTLGSGGGLWHLTTARSSGGSHIGLYYGHNEGPDGGGNYDTGTANGGAVYSPLIALPATGAPVLAFDYLMSVEADTNYDNATVEISTDGWATCVPLAIKGVPGGLTNVTGGNWVRFSTGLEGYRGQTVQFRFRFDTLDAVGNTTEGWFIDNIGISKGFGGVDSFDVSPADAGPFVNGVWSGRVAVQCAATNVLLIADDDAGHTGSSNPFDLFTPVDVSLSVVGSPNPVFTASNLTYTVSVTNHGTVPATGLMLTDALPLNAIVESVSVSQGTWTNAEGALLCGLGDLPPGGAATLVLRVTPTQIGMLTNAACVAANEGDPSPDNNAQITLTEVINNPPFISSIGDQVTDEDVPLAVQFTYGDVETPLDAVTLAVESSATNVVPASGLLLWGSGNARTLTLTPAANQSGAAAITVTVSDAQAVATVRSFALTVRAVNDAPVLEAIAGQSIMEEQPITFTAVATDVDGLPETLSFHLDSTAPDGAAIDPATGAFTWTPAEAQGPSTNAIHIIVTDEGVPSLSATQTVTVAVSERNRAPVLPPVGDSTISEDTMFTLVAGATDPDLPANPLQYSLAEGAPAGAVIDTVSGLFTWTPAEVQGPGTNRIGILVTDGFLVATRSFQLVVLEANRAPVLAALPDLVVNPSRKIAVQVAATDADVPTNQLVFQLEPGAPSGAAINPATGLFTWTPRWAALGTNVITVRVTDTGAPALSDIQSFNIVVVRNPIIDTFTVAGRTVRIGWASEQGQLYAVQRTGDLNSNSWTTIYVRAATDDHTTVTDDLGANPSARDSQRFYRVILVSFGD